MSRWYLGTIGFSYKEWVGAFYPKGTTRREYLPYYSKVFNSVELDTTFHSVPQPTTVQSWSVISPPDFKFCVKTPRTITHDLGLIGVQGLMEEFIESLSPLKEKVGTILVQLPPAFSQEYYPVLSNFFEKLPKAFSYAVEFRHPSWYNEKTTKLLSQYRVCWVTLDYPNIPNKINVTSDFLYIRWIGVNGMYHNHSYERVDKTNQLRAWIQDITPFLEQVPFVYGFFNNDYTGFAAGACKRFMRLAGLYDDEQKTPYQEKLF